MIRALIFDLDGTLLDSSKRIPDSACMALQAARDKGLRIFFCTARSARLDKMLGWGEREFSLFDGGIYCNGAVMRLGGETRHAFIDPAAVRGTLEILREYEDVHLSLHMENEVHAFNFTLPDDMLGPWGLAREEIAVIDDHACRTATKLLIFHDSLVDAVRTLPEELFGRLKSTLGGLASFYLTDQGRTIQVVSLDAGKKQAIRRLRAELKLHAEETAVFGDDVNDLDMIADCPNSVAMGNGAESVRAAAAYVTLANDEDGVAYALRELLGILPQSE